MGGSPSNLPPSPATSPPPSSPTVAHWNIAKYYLTRSHRRMINCSGPIPVFLRIMTSEIRGVREKWYNRAFCGLCCTRIPAGLQGDKNHVLRRWIRVPAGVGGSGRYATRAGYAPDTIRKTSRPVAMGPVAGNLPSRDQSSLKKSYTKFSGKNLQKTGSPKKYPEIFFGRFTRASVPTQVVSPRGRSRQAYLV